ncbi:MAG: phosphoribosylaminoimidazolesuccinocarboxamide synthase [Armatimonadota bacterium]
MNTIFETNIPGLTPSGRGKVRDLYDLGDKLLFVATDRLSAFDVVFPTPIPGKGRVLTQMTLFWLDKLSDIVENHLISTSVDELADALRQAGAEDLDSAITMLEGRSMLVKKARPFPIECVVRGYISGSLWKDYQNRGGADEVYGIALPAGLVESQKLPEPIFTPATKATSGHDENISGDEAANVVGLDVFERLKELSIAIYTQASEIASSKGLILADTKLEFGHLNSEIILIDEVLTPDSSRYWDGSSYEAGRPQDSFDKQYVRDWVLDLGWNKTPPAPLIPEAIVAGTTERYVEAYRRITGREL